MPLYDYECPKCGHVFEVIEKASENHVLDCPKCGKLARRIISVGRPFDSVTDSPWLKSVVEVVGRETPEGREFHRSQTRANYQAWMKAKGLRPLEPGEKPSRPSVPSSREMAEATWKQHQRRHALEVRTR